MKDGGVLHLVLNDDPFRGRVSFDAVVCGD